MCGIAGLINLDGAPADPGVLRRMAELQRHRGPDDQGLRLFSLEKGRSVEPFAELSFDSGAPFSGGLAFNRLSILDLSELGHQPMTNADENVFIAFNGEIYNAFDYREELEAKGFRFRSRTDTEVILYLYECYGLDGMLERLNGMFAIVIVDLRLGEALIARDHLGVKPLYWWTNGRVLLFASEAKALLAHPEFPPELDESNLDEYLAYRFCAGENHLLKGVRQLRPGHLMRVRSGEIGVRRYWEIPDEVEKSPVAERDAVDQLEHHLRSAVQRQLISDVKVGCQLSGGIDSSLVSVFARSHFDADMDTFSIVFDDAEYSEERWISAAAGKANADSHRYMFTSDVFLNSLQRATWHLDQPLNHPNSLGIYHMAERARSEVTVLLSGEGADELMGGYMRFYYTSVQPRIAPFMGILRGLPGVGSKFERNFGTSGNRVESFLAASLFQRAPELQQLRPHADLTPATRSRRELFAEGKADHLSNCLKFDMQTYMVDLLIRQDKMTMAHSIENRVPFLDRELVSFVRKLPRELLVDDTIRPLGNRMRNTKVLLKKLAERWFSRDFVYRPKSGFSLPLVRYYTDSRFAQLMEDQLLPGMAGRGLLSASVVRDWWKNIANLGKGMDETLWISIALELWAQRFLDASFVGMPHDRGYVPSLMSAVQPAKSDRREHWNEERAAIRLAVEAVGRPSRAKGGRPLRVTFLWAEVSGYIAACWEALAERHDVALHIIHLEGLASAPVPGRDSLLSKISNEVLSVANEELPTSIARRVARRSPDLIVTSGWLYRPYVQAAQDPSLHSAALVIGMDSPWEGRWKQHLARFALRSYLARADAFMVAGDRSREYARRLGVPAERIFTGLYGYDFRHFAGASTQLREDAPWPRKFLFTGRYVNEKALDTLVSAYQRYRESSHEAWALSFCGMGPMEGLLKDVPGVQDFGYVEPRDLAALFAQHGAFIMPSRFEPWGVAIGEAAASGMPLICSTACGAALELLRPFFNGLSFATDDSGQLAYAMSWMEEHYQELPLMGQRSQQLAEAHSAEVWADRWADCFRFALEQRKCAVR